MTSSKTKKERLELIAIGPADEDHWRRIIPEGRRVRLGRAPKNGWSVPWDRWISREQADILMRDHEVRVTCLPTATNKISWQGELCDECSLEHGDEFNIGQTRFVIGPTAQSAHEKMTAVDNPAPRVEDLVQQPQAQRLEQILEIISGDERQPRDPQAATAKTPSGESSATAAESPSSPQEAGALQKELERQQERQREIAAEAKRLAQQKNERSIEARYLREEVAELRSKLRKKSKGGEAATGRRGRKTIDDNAETAAEVEQQKEAEVAALQEEIQNLQQLLNKQLASIEKHGQNVGTNTQLEMTRKSLEAERQARESAQHEADTLREEIATLQQHMKDVQSGKKPNQDQGQENANALETHLGLAAVEQEDQEGGDAGQAGVAVFRDYELLNQIYNATTGQVIKAKHQRMNRMVAIKLLSETNQNTAMVGRFARKVQILAFLNHPNLVAAYDAGQEGDIHFLITEYIPGRSLIRLLKRIRQLDIPNAIHFICQTCDALEYVHSQRIYHRNINPSHLLVTPEKTIKIVGWGSALFEGDAKLKEYEAQGVFVGTPDYVAPEQIENASTVDQRADIYSLGCTLYSILTKQVIFPVDWSRRKLIAQRHKPAPNLKDLRPDAPNLLEHIFQKMVAKEPEERFQTMGEVREALQAVVQLPQDD